MQEPIKWLVEADGTPWTALANALRKGLPVPNGFVVFPPTAEGEIRNACEELKIREKTHFLAVRGSSRAVLNVIGPDPLIHTLRRLWTESPDLSVLIQRMIHAMWCGKAQWQRRWVRAMVVSLCQRMSVMMVLEGAVNR